MKHIVRPGFYLQSRAASLTPREHRIRSSSFTCCVRSAIRFDIVAGQDVPVGIVLPARRASPLDGVEEHAAVARAAVGHLRGDCRFTTSAAWAWRHWSCNFELGRMSQALY